jgi:hypothetical protein
MGDAFSHVGSSVNDQFWSSSPVFVSVAVKVPDSPDGMAGYSSV